MSHHEFERENSQEHIFSPLLLYEGEHHDTESHRSHDFGPLTVQGETLRPPAARAYFVRALALLCACSLSIGSHYASYILSPLKSRLSREMGTSNTEFSLLISAFSLNSTWTPLVGGVLASRLGTTVTSVLATGIIFLGQALLLLGDLTANVRLMAFGMFIFGLGVSPLAVVQETIIVRFFRSHGLGISMALGLIAGKGASFISAHTSYPLTERYGPHAPFYTATALAALSVVVNLIYILASKWLVDGSGAELEASDLHEEAQRRSLHNYSEARALHQVAEKRKVDLKEVTKLGDVFWAYIGLNVLCGALWSPFTHLAANIIERRYNLTERDASDKASYLLVGSIFLYPICGFVVDRLRSRSTVIRLFMLSSCLTMFCYAWLVLPPTWTQTPIPAIIAFGTGIGFSPLLLVVIVPQLVPHKYVSTTLGAHKSLEQAGSTIFQTLAGLSLDTARKPNSGSNTESLPRQSGSSQNLLNALLLVNILQYFSTVGLSFLERRQRHNQVTDVLSDVEVSEATAAVTRKVPGICESDGWEGARIQARHSPPDPTSTPEQRRPLLPPMHTDRAYPPSPSPPSPPEISFRARREIRRGEVFVWLSGMLIFFAWVLFMGTAWLKLRSKADRGTSESIHH